MKYFEIKQYQGVMCIDLIKEFPKTMKRKRALELSILKWETIVNYLKINEGKVIDNDGDTCALCELYVNRMPWTAEECGRCPVALMAGTEGCYSTPWRGKASLYDAQAELEFLKEIWNDLYS